MSKLMAALAFTLFSGALYAQQTGELWEMSMSIGESNGPLMPMMNNKVCMPKEKNAGEKMLKPEDDRNCKTEMKATGKKNKFKTVCVKDGETTTMEGVQEMLGPDHIKTDSTMTIENRKGKEVMRQSMTMKKVGTCKPENPADKMAEQMRQSCGELAESMYAPAFLDKNGHCKADKALFCNKVKADAEASRDPYKYNKHGPDWGESTKACGVDFAAITRTACQRSIESRNWSFVTDNCPSETKELAAKHCAGRDYTSIMQSGYSQICRAASPDIARHEAARDEAEAAGSAPASGSKKAKADKTDKGDKGDKTKNMLDVGRDMLKSLF